MYSLLLLILLLRNDFNNNLLNKASYNNFFFLLLILILTNKNVPCSPKKQKNSNNTKINLTNSNTETDYTDIPFDYLKKILTEDIEENTLDENQPSYLNYSKKYNNDYINISDEYPKNYFTDTETSNLENTSKYDHTIKTTASNDKFNSNKYINTLDENQPSSLDYSGKYNDDYMNIAFGYPDNYYTDTETSTLEDISEETIVNSDSIVKSNTEHTNLKNTCIKNNKIKSNDVVSILNEYYRGTKVSIVVSDLGVITGNIVFNFSSVIALKLENNITVFINKDLISNFF